jgi:glutamyl-Q tRNA(Asp) synthetase
MLQRYDCIYHILRSRGEMGQNTVTRFAPSPTGQLHLGHAYSAILAHDFARERGGRFFVRIEDIDRGRCRAAFVEGIFDDLRWLGLDWDCEVMVQSERTEHYVEALGRLSAMGLLYRCRCTRAEIALSASAPHGETGSIYPGTCREQDDANDPRPFCWRLNVAAAINHLGPERASFGWEERSSGFVPATPYLMGDVVIARKDADASYHLAVTVDDAAQGVTDIIRGRDLFASTHIHRLLQALLGLPTPRYSHHALLMDSDGERLAKRRNSPTIAALRERGVDPKHVVEGLRVGPFPFGIVTETSKE